jgi:hypothetical protein
MMHGKLASLLSVVAHTRARGTGLNATQAHVREGELFPNRKSQLNNFRVQGAYASSAVQASAPGIRSVDGMYYWKQTAAFQHNTACRL